MASKKNRIGVYRWQNKETGEHYTVRLSREAYDKLKDSKANKFSKKLRRHSTFELIKWKSK